MVDVLLASVLIALCVLGAELTRRTCLRLLRRPLSALPVRPPVADRASAMLAEPALAEN